MGYAPALHGQRYKCPSPEASTRRNYTPVQPSRPIQSSLLSQQRLPAEPDTDVLCIRRLVVHAAASKTELIRRNYHNFRVVPIGSVFSVSQWIASELSQTNRNGTRDALTAQKSSNEESLIPRRRSQLGLKRLLPPRVRQWVTAIFSVSLLNSFFVESFGIISPILCSTPLHHSWSNHHHKFHFVICLSIRYRL